MPSKKAQTQKENKEKMVNLTTDLEQATIDLFGENMIKDVQAINKHHIEIIKIIGKRLKENPAHAQKLYESQLLRMFDGLSNIGKLKVLGRMIDAMIIEELGLDETKLTQDYIKSLKDKKELGKMVT